MKVLVVYDGFEVESCNGKYYHNFLNDIIKRYSYFGELTITAVINTVTSPSGDEINVSGVKLVPLKKINTVKGLLFDKYVNTRTVKRLVADSDFVICHIPSDVASVAISEATKMGKPSFAMVIGCPWDALWNYNWKGKILAPISFLSNRIAVSKADYVQYVTKEFLQKRYPSKNTQIGCSDVCIYDINKESASVIQKRWGAMRQSSQRNIVTCAAVGAPYKGQSYVIKAISILNRKGFNFHYHLYGGGSQERLKALSISEGIEQYVHFYGSCPHEEIMNVLKDMDVYAQPSLQEGLPRSIVEAMSVGLPVIASDGVGGMNELTMSTMRFRKKDVNSIVNILMADNDKWIESSKWSLKLAEQYEYSFLQKIRDTFFENVKREIEG